MNKTLRIILNILIVIASLACVISAFNLISSISYANREVEDPAETYAGIFEYTLEHRAYGEIMDDYYAKRLSSFEPAAGYEDMYKVAEYAHDAFMTKIMIEKGDAKKESMYADMAKTARGNLGPYAYTADEIDGMIEGAIKGGK